MGRPGGCQRPCASFGTARGKLGLHRGKTYLWDVNSANRVQKPGFFRSLPKCCIFGLQLEEFFHKTIRILLAHAMPFSQRVNQVLYVQFLIHNTGDFFKSRLLKLIL